MLLPGWLGFALNPDPTSLDLCSPPADEAVYTIDVEQIGVRLDARHLLAQSGEVGGENGGRDSGRFDHRERV